MTLEPAPQGNHEASPLVLVGYVRGPAGMQGEVRVNLHSDIPHRFAPGDKVRIGGTVYRVDTRRAVRSDLLIKFREVTSRAAAAAIHGESIYVTEKEVPPSQPDTYYHYQLLDMLVVTTSGTNLGVITDVLETGANDVYVVKGPEKETLVPAMADVVKEVDVEGGRMVVDLPEGL
jgi:16S rRNA processing protein RimM